MKKLNQTDQLFRRSLENDCPDLEPDKAVEERINQYYLVSRSKQKVHANSFQGLFLWIFSLKGLGLKAGFATACLAYFLLIGNINNKTVNQQFSDTCHINTVTPDSNYIAKDTCR